MAKARPPSDSAAPDQRKLSERQARRLAGLTGLEAESIAGLTIVDVSEKLKWRFDPAIDVKDAEDAIAISFQELVVELRQAAQAGEIDSLKDRLDDFEGRARKR